MNKCQNCNTETKNPRYCCRSCSASATNKNRVHSTESKMKTSATLKLRYGPSKQEKLRLSFEDCIVGPYTRIYLCTCKLTGEKWFSKTKKTIHPNHAKTFKEYQYACRFNFSINHYPDKFPNASELIKTYGWYSTPGSNKSGIRNVNGISRDHKVSVSYGFKNNIPPNIIRHPANCELLPHIENQKKRSKCSISLEQLLEDIATFDK